MRAIAALSFVAIFAFGAPFPLIIAAAAAVGWMGAKAGLRAFRPGAGHRHGPADHVDDAETLLGAETVAIPAHARRGALIAGLVALVAWLLPVGLIVLTLGPSNVFSQIATFFSTMAVVTFGGAYAVLAYVAQEAVGTFGWLQPGEMLDGLGMAETTPGPLIMVVQFVGFMGAFREAGGLLAGTVGGLLATWVTFAPCFAWIFLGAPWMERLRKNPSITAALTAVTAAVTGVILNLAIWFAIHVIWQEVIRIDAGPLSMELPRLSSINWAAAVLSILAIFAVFRLKLGMATVLAGAAAAGVLLYLSGLAGGAMS